MHKTKRAISGVTLIELMVGLTIGLLMLLAVFRVFSDWDGRQRTGSSKDDALTVGTLASVSLENDLRQASYGVGPASSPVELRTGCVINATVAGTPITFNLMPVEIINGASGASDALTVLYGSATLRAGREFVVASDDLTKTLLNPAGFLAGDHVVLTNSGVPNSCQLVQVAIAGSPFSHLAPGTGTNEFDQAFNLGPTPTSNVWQVGGGSPLRPVLQRQNQLPTAGAASPTVDVAEGIVNLQAQYGYDSNDDGQISAAEWIDTLPAVTDWSQVLAVRYGMLARSRHYEAMPFRANRPSWAGGRFAMADLSNWPGGADTDPLGANNWRAYRYVVYEGVVPIRNVLWGQKQ